MRQRQLIRRFAWIFLCVPLLLASCGKKEDDAKNESENFQNNAENNANEENSKSQNPNNQDPNNQNPNAQNSEKEKENEAQGEAGENPENPSGGMSQEIGAGTDSETSSVKKPGELLDVKGKVLSGLAIVGEEEAVYCNEPENSANPESLLPICYDPLYGILYYTNYGRNDKIYALRDGNAEVVVDFPGKRLFCREGKLYFIVNSNTIGAKSGNVLSYDPQNGDITVISDEIFDSMTVYQDMIYLWQTKSIGPNLFTKFTYFYSFERKELMSAKSSSDKRYQNDWITELYEEKDRAEWEDSDWEFYNFQIAAGEKPEDIKLWRRAGFGLYDLDEETEIALENLSLGTEEDGKVFFVKGEEIFWFVKKDLHCYNILDKTEKIVDIKLGLDQAAILIDGRAYTSGGIYTNLEDGKWERYEIVLQEGGVKDIGEFFIAKDRLYCMNGIPGDIMKLCRVDIVTAEDGSIVFHLVAPNQNEKK